MAIFKVHSNDGYTAMSNHHLRDTELSWGAMGMLSFMLSCREDFKFSILGLSQCSACGEAATRSALDELKKKGYIRTQRIVDSSGKVVEWQYDVYESPDVENPHVVNPDVEMSGQRNTKVSNTKESNSLSLFEESEIPQVQPITKKDLQFERFWNVYDKKVQRAQAEKMWSRLKAEEKKEILEKVSLYVLSTPDVQFRMNPATYINPANRRWQDEVRLPQHQQSSAGPVVWSPTI